MNPAESGASQLMEDLHLESAPQKNMEDDSGSSSGDEQELETAEEEPISLATKYDSLPLAEKRKFYKCKSKFVTLEQIPTWQDYCSKNSISNAPECLSHVSEFNQKISLFRGDSTSLEIDAIVNAANTSLLGGGGIDGAIHNAAGKFNLQLHGCRTGQTKISPGFKLPAKYVLSTVGPTFESPQLLTSCYSTCLQVAKKHNIKSLAFCCISTGIYGYPLENATHVALSTVRKWMEQNSQFIDRVIFVVFLEKELKCYEKWLPYYFPPNATTTTTDTTTTEPNTTSTSSSSEQ